MDIDPVEFLNKQLSPLEQREWKRMKARPNKRALEARDVPEPERQVILAGLARIKEAI